MKAKAAFYFLILRRQLLSLERYRRKKVLKLRSIAELRAFYGMSLFQKSAEQPLVCENVHKARY